ncbi:MAG: DUF6519 domain-containing protein [Acidobacteriota bacterium]
MRNDTSRNTFRPNRHYSRVLMQQGRVLLDADWNEQAAIFHHYLQTLARDLIGPYGGPAKDWGFKILNNNDADAQHLPEINLNFWIGPGRYYVDGLLCENDGFCLYAPPVTPPGNSQADFIPEKLVDGKYLVYLDVWERHVTALEDEAIREVALGPQGPDTTTRVKVVWQVKTFKLEGTSFDNFQCNNSIEQTGVSIHEGWADLLKELQPANRGLLRAKADEPDDINASNPCIISPDARYRGAENQLYRVEIHQGQPGTATFKWSRENGSVALPIRSISGNKVTLEHMGRDERFGLQVGDWVEIEGTNYENVDRLEAPALLEVEEVNYVDMFVILSGPSDTSDSGRVLRRWDQKAGDLHIGGSELRNGAVLIKEGTPQRENWLTLEDGVQIQFQQGAAPNTYRRGDYWLIPARTATGDVEWPGPLNAPEAIPPHGVQHHYAPLARITLALNNVTEVVADLRRRFTFFAQC